jgi:erythromycin esterase
MAENVAWWHETHAPGAKMVLWAHNGHIIRVPGRMGEHLSQRYGDGYFVIGQTFGTGSFNAVMVSNADVNLDLRAHSVSTMREDAIERVFTATGIDRLVFDARRLRSESSQATLPLESPLSIRAIGATYKPVAADLHSAPTLLSVDYDLIIWFRNATASTLLPFLP